MAIHLFCRMLPSGFVQNRTKYCHFILSESTDFHMVMNLSTAIHVLPLRKLTSLSVDEILLPRFVNLSTNTDNLMIN